MRKLISHVLNYFEKVNSADFATTVELDIMFGEALIKGAFATGELGGESNEIDASVFTQREMISIPGQTSAPSFTVQIRTNDSDMTALQADKESGEEKALVVKLPTGSSWNAKGKCTNIAGNALAMNSSADATATFQITEPWSYKPKAAG